MRKPSWVPGTRAGARGLRPAARALPKAAPHVLGKQAVLRLSRVLEGGCALRARGPVVFACFQQKRFYRESEPRCAYRRAAIVLADFDRARRPRHAPAEVRLERSAELRREWAVVFDAPNVAACLTAWERPARKRRRGPRRGAAHLVTEPAGHTRRSRGPSTRGERRSDRLSDRLRRRLRLAARANLDRRGARPPIPRR